MLSGCLSHWLIMEVSLPSTSLFSLIANCYAKPVQQNFLVNTHVSEYSAGWKDFSRKICMVITYTMFVSESEWIIPSNKNFKLPRAIHLLRGCLISTYKTMMSAYELVILRPCNSCSRPHDIIYVSELSQKKMENIYWLEAETLF